MDAQPISDLELARLRARGRQSALGRVAAELSRPADGWQTRLRWTAVAIADEWRRWQAALPELVQGDFLFTLALWVGVFSVAAIVVAQPAIPLAVRYSAGLAAVAYLYLYAELARGRRQLPYVQYLLGAADVAAVLAIGALSLPYAGYARVLLFLAALRLAARFPSLRAVAVGLLVLLVYELAGHAPLLTAGLDGFAVVCTMLLVIHLSRLSASAEQATRRQSVLAQLASTLARSRDEETLFAQLAAQAPALLPGCAWAFWLKEPGREEFRAVRWAQLPDGELPIFTFTPAQAADRSEAVLITGPLPGTSAGEFTLVQPTSSDGEPTGLITVAGKRSELDSSATRLVRQVAEEMGNTLARLQALDEQRQRTDAMEQANRLAGLAARYATDQQAALGAIGGAALETLRSESLHLEWVEGDGVELVLAEDDALMGHAPERLTLAGTRSAETLLEGRPLREPTTGRRPEDLFMVPAGLRQVAVAPIKSAGRDGTLQLARRLPRPYSASELMVLQLLADRLGLLFASAQDRNPREVSI